MQETLDDVGIRFQQLHTDFISFSDSFVLQYKVATMTLKSDASCLHPVATKLKKTSTWSRLISNIQRLDRLIAVGSPHQLDPHMIKLTPNEYLMLLVI